MIRREKAEIVVANDNSAEASWYYVEIRAEGRALTVLSKQHACWFKEKHGAIQAAKWWAKRLNLDVRIENAVARREGGE